MVTNYLKFRQRCWSTDSAREFQRWRFEEGDDTVPGRQAGGNVETFGETLARMVAEALDDIIASRSEGPDTW